MHVLYVEDDVAMAKIVERMLRDEGYQCETTGLGRRAVTLGKEKEYDLILLDVMLPDIDGYEVIRELREAGIATPFLIQSGLLDRNRVTDDSGFGVDDFLIKPFNKSELLERIESVIARSSKNTESTQGPPPEPPLDKVVERPATAAERRQHRRFSTEIPAQILHRGRTDCTIINMSHGGVAIRLPDADAPCPPSFALVLASGTKRHCLQCWRHRDMIGAKFLCPPGP